ncbi:protein OBERON 4-like protein isoform X1 [Cinnamomum micranthum f. kanehirae]|uniref:Protein OBERON 4-like protein isoform X1 n=1 Tax=Cinnamomum micranthum f. kanehirae TaxID=337451 RepID=A0A3S3MFT3_9MAGN|nr:protein OBERON 4-like protein isoform X1 [Cinnamomum micranthum f. kanehirae]
MKRPRSYGEDLDDDWDRRDHDLDRSLSHRRLYPKPENGRRGSYDDEREASRSSRKRSDHESEGFDRRKGFDRYRDRSDRSAPISSPRSSYSGERIHRSESFSVSRREFDKSFWTERDRLRREESVSAWRRSVIGKDADEDQRGFGAANMGKGSQSGSEDKACLRSPAGSREIAKSPPWSKDSGSERSKSVELKKSGEAHGESSSRSSEMEEGELEPESDPEPEPETESQPLDGVEKAECSIPECEMESESEKEMKSLHEEKLEIEEKRDCNEKQPQEEGMVENATNVVTEDKTSNHEDEDAVNKSGEKEEAEASEGVEKEETNAGEEWKSLPSPDYETESDRGREEQNEETDLEKRSTSEVGCKEQEGIDPKVKAEEDDSFNADEEAADEKKMANVTLSFLSDKLNGNCKDKGKGVAVYSSNDGDSSDDGGWLERDLLSGTGREIDIEGPSCRGFELFFPSDATRAGKANRSAVVNLNEDTKLSLEPLQLSLGLPNVLPALDSQNPKQAAESQSCAPNSPSHGRSVQSMPTTFCTGSDGFTASISFSGSQQFVHNQSCSLTHNSFENYEQSVGSRPIFQGVDQVPQGGSWQGLSSNELKCKEVPLFQGMLQNGNGTLNGSHASQGHFVQGHRTRKVPEVSNRIPNGLDQQLSLPRQLSGQLRHDGARSPSHSVGSRETRSDRSMDKKKVMRESNGGDLLRTGQREMENILNSTDVGVRIVARIISEPIQIMARGIQEMAEQSMACLKESVCELIDKEEKRGQLCAFQERLWKRSDLTLEALANCHRTQLEILVAVKTGLRDFLRETDRIPSSDLANIFLNFKCRNLACGSNLPVDDCECKVCVKKNGFCSACMCLVCLKFDMASNTCSWVGCDVCLHWCHTECGLRNRHVRNGRSATGTQGQTEMQFHCIACGHPSEMFGFVKEVFRTCAKDWKAETLCKELKYVKRIFRASDDLRGKQMHDVAARMLEKLENGSNPSDVYDCMMTFLTEGDSKIGNNPPSSSSKDLSHRLGEGSNGKVGPSLDTKWLRSISAEKAPPIENAGSILPSLDWERIGRQTEVKELQLHAGKKPVADELESIVRIKQAEAKMFQARADDARREAEALKRIAIAKNEKIEEEYAKRIAKLHLVEVEEKRRQKLEELHALEKAHCEYFKMKRRMEADIKDLLLKVEATKRNLSS